MKGKKVVYNGFYCDVIEQVGDWLVIRMFDKTTKQVNKSEVKVIGNGN